MTDLRMISYLPFGDAAAPQEMVVWEGGNVAYLTPPDGGFSDPAVMGDIVAGTDRAYAWYEALTGRDPSPWHTLEGRDTIAFLPTTPGAAAIGLVGHTGVEIQPEFAQALYDEVREGDFDRLPLYELGRNFWFYSDQLGGLETSGLMNGFATLNQFLAAEHAGLDLAEAAVPGPGWSLSLAQMEELLDLYLADEDAGWDLLGGRGYDAISVDGLGFAATRGNLAGAFYHQILEDHGEEGYAAFWHEVGMLGRAATLEEVKDNFLAAAERATGEDYGWLFKEPPEVDAPPEVGQPDAVPTGTDWDSIAAQITANYLATGNWFF